MQFLLLSIIHVSNFILNKNFNYSDIYSNSIIKTDFELEKMREEDSGVVEVDILELVRLKTQFAAFNFTREIFRI